MIPSSVNGGGEQQSPMLTRPPAPNVIVLALASELADSIAMATKTARNPIDVMF
jgi:hypothetical protein